MKVNIICPVSLLCSSMVVTTLDPSVGPCGLDGRGLLDPDSKVVQLATDLGMGKQISKYDVGMKLVYIT